MGAGHRGSARDDRAHFARRVRIHDEANGMSSLPLPVVVGNDLPRAVRQVLRPGETLHDRSGAAHVLPSSFLRVDSWNCALETVLTPHFKLWEFIGVDVREAALMRSYPCYVPCAV